jgi:Flp pilus assembly protein TadG
MRIGASRRLVRDQQGGVAVEFVALLPAFLFLTFFVFDIGIAVLWVGTVEKAAQLGARLAIVSNYAVTTLVPGQKNQTADANMYPPGSNCPTGCAAFATQSCTGGSGGICNPAGFNAIFNRMDAIANVLQPANITITYTYVGLGFVGGPIVPRVTVTVQGVPYNTVTSSILQGLEPLTGVNFPGLTTIPPVTATFTGEDLSSLGAS